MFYGWVIVGVAFLTIMSSMGMWYTFSVFYVEILKEFGWSRAATAGVFLIYGTVHGLSSPLVGLAVRRWGARAVIVAGSLIMFVGLALSSRTSSIWHLFLFLGCIVAAGGAAMGYPPNSAIVANWFERRRGLAMGITFAGNGSGLFFFPKLSQVLIDAVGWRTAYLYLGFVVLLLVLPMNLLFSRFRPEEKGLTPDGLPPAPRAAHGATPAPSALKPPVDWTLRRAFRSSPFWLINASYALTAVCLQIVMMHQFAFLTDLGVARSLAAALISAVGVASIAGQLLGGSICDRSGSEVAFSVHTGFVILALVVLMLIGQARLMGGVYLYPILWGLGAAGTGMIVVVASAEIFQGPNFAAVAGYHSLAWGIGGGIGPIFAGWIYDLTRSYQSAFLVAILLALAGAAAIWLAAPRTYRQARRAAGTQAVT